MGLGSIRENQLVRWDNKLLKLVGRSQNGEWLLTDQVSGLMDHQSETAIWTALERGELQFVCYSDALPPERTQKLLAQLSGAATHGSTKKAGDPKQLHAVYRQDYLKIFVEHQWHIAEEKVEALWKKLQWPSKRPPCRASLYAWLAKASKSDDPIAELTSKDDLKGRRVWYPQRTLDILRDIRDDHYLKRGPIRIAKSRAPIRISKAVEYAKNAILLKNAELPLSERHKIPGRRAMVSVINEVPVYEQLALRYGVDYARKMMRTSLGGVETTRPLERVECDHTLLAVLLFDEDFTPWGRADMTLALDAHTKCVPGFYTGAETDSIVALAHCIRSSVLPKNDFLTKYPDVQGALPCFGAAETYIADNCFAAFAPALRQACSELGGSTVEFCPRGSPWFKPNVERQFRTQDADLLQTLPAATMENIVRRYGFNIKTDMLLRRSTFNRIHMKWLVDIYHRKPQAGLNGLSPIDAFKREIGLFDQFVPTKTILIERLFLRDSSGRDGEGHLLDHEGIEYDCLIYNSSDMGELRASLGSVLRVKIRVSDEDLGHIFVEVPGHDVWIRVPCLDQKYAKGLTRWQHEKCKRMKTMLRVEGLEVSLAEAQVWILNEIELEQEEFRLALKKRAARFKEQHNGARPTEDAPAPEVEEVVQSSRSVHTPHEGSLGKPLAREGAVNSIQTLDAEVIEEHLK